MKKGDIFNIAKAKVGKMGVPLTPADSTAKLRRLKETKRTKRS